VRSLGVVLASAGAKAAATALSLIPLVDARRSSFQGKAMRFRAVAYPAMTLALPAAWLAAGRPRPYPWRADVALSCPLVVDAGGNVLGLFARFRHFDRLPHFLGWTFVSLAAGDAVQPMAGNRALTLVAAAGVGAIVAVAWEIGEHAAWKRGASGLDLTYDDTIDDLAFSLLGSVAGAAASVLRPASDGRASSRRLFGWA
jgi:hypothetical protein